MIGAIDVDGTKITVGLVDASGKVCASGTMNAQPSQSYSSCLEDISRMLRGLLEENGERLEGIGIGCGGQIDPREGTVLHYSFLPNWTGENPPKTLSHTFQTPAAMENDADAAVLSEWAWGAGRGAQRFIYVTVSTGIGVGMVFDGKLYRGAGGLHPEIGHHCIDLNGPECFCGSRGCWETLAGGRALQTRMEGCLTAKRICELARKGDSTALAAIEQHSFYLGTGLANLITLCAPDAIALGGGLMHSADLFWEGMLRSIAQHCRLIPWEKTRILRAELEPNTGLVGAAQVYLQRFGV